MNEFLDILVDIASTPAILVALIAVLGNVLQKRHCHDRQRGDQNLCWVSRGHCRGWGDRKLSGAIWGDVPSSL